MKLQLTILMVLAVTIVHAQRQEVILEQRNPGHPQSSVIDHRGNGEKPAGIWVNWDDGKIFRAVGWGNVEWATAARFTPADIEAFDGWELTRMNVGVGGIQGVAAKIAVWQGEDVNSLEKKVMQEFDIVAKYEWHMVELDEPYVVDASKELWIGVIWHPTNGGLPAAADEYTDHPGKGDMIRTPAGFWVSMLEDYGIEGDWNIQGFLEGVYCVTFNIEMSYATFNGTAFDPHNHDVYISGTFATWYDGEKKKQWAMPGSDDKYKLELVTGLEPEVMFFEDFTDGAIPEGWLNIDNNGDGKKWEIAPYPSYKPHSGDFAVKSHSWEGTPLNPDNWLITPQIYIPFDDYQLSFYVKAQDPGNVAENYSVLVSTTTPSIGEFETIHTETLTSDQWKKVTLPLEEYEGKNIYIAFRHHDCTDQLNILLDEIAVTGTPPYMYRISFENIYPGPYEYKYFIVEEDPTWDNTEWEWDPEKKEPNRGIVITGEDIETDDLWGELVWNYVAFIVVNEAGQGLGCVDFELNKMPLPPSYKVSFITHKADPPPPIIMDGTVITLDGRELYQDPETAQPFQMDFHNVEPGEYDFSAAHDDFLTEFGTVEVVDKHVEVNVYFVEGEAPQHSITFNIMDTEGAPVQNATVLLAGNKYQTGANGQVTIEATERIYVYNVLKDGYYFYKDEVIIDGNVTENVVLETDKDPGFFIFDLIDGVYKYSAYLSGYKPATDNVKITDHYNTILITLKMYRTVTFDILDEDGNPIDNAIVVFDGIENEPGDYVFENIIAGTYEYSITAEDYADVHDVIVVTDDVDQPETHVTVTMKDAYFITFNVDMTDATFTAYGEDVPFDPGVHNVYVSGPEWPVPGSEDAFLLEPVGGNGNGDDGRENGELMYARTIPLAEGEYEYKYYIVIYGETWNYPDLPEEQYRQLTVGAGYGDFSVYDIWGEYEGVPDPVTEIYEIFKEGVLPEYWQNVDHSGDGYRWEFVHYQAGYSPKEGEYAAMSRSRDNDPLQPDNWLITRQVNVAGSDYTLSFRVKTKDPDWPHEHYSVLISTGDPIVPGVFKEIHSETLTAEDDGWKKVTLDLAGYKSELIYIAFRHWDCTDWYQILIDEIEVKGTVGVAGIDKSPPVKIYPNPARDKFHVVSSETIKQVRLINTGGQVLKDIIVNEPHTNIRVQNLRTGIYFMQIHTANSVITERVQIVR